MVNADEIPRLETDRLLLRGLSAADAQTFAGVLQLDPDFLKYVPARVGLTPEERAERLVRNYLRRSEESPLGMRWAVVLDENTLIGVAGVDALSETETTDGNRIVAYVVPENVGSVRAVAKLGYERRGSVNYLELMGNPAGVELFTPMADEYSLARDEWMRRTAQN